MFTRRSASSHIAPARQGPAQRPSARSRVTGGTRWTQLLLGIVCMTMIANLQYGWTLFVTPIDEKYHWGAAAIQLALTIFIAAQTWTVPVAGWLTDRFGPRYVVLAGGLLAGSAWVLDAFAGSPYLLYAGAALGGLGAAAIYGSCIGNAVKWFADQRGLATGLTAAGFGMGSAASIVPLQTLIGHSGYEAAFLYFGVGQGVVLCLLAWFLRAPDGEEVSSTQAVQMMQSARQYSPGEMLASPVFWILYAMFALVCGGGLMAAAQLGTAAKDLGIAGTPVSLAGLTLPALAFALSAERILNGLARPFFGLVSDWIGRETTMLAAFGLEAAGILALNEYGADPVLFVVLAGLVVFAWGAIYSLFPAVCADIYGSKHAATNTGLLYTAQGVAAFLLPLGNSLGSTGGGWHTVFIIGMVMNLTAALAALVILKPARMDLHTRSFVSLTGPAKSIQKAGQDGKAGGFRLASPLGASLIGGGALTACAIAGFLFLGKEAPKPPIKQKPQVVVAVPEELLPTATAEAVVTAEKPPETAIAVPEAPAALPEAAPAAAAQPEAALPETKTSPEASAPKITENVEKPAATPAPKAKSTKKNGKKKKKHAASEAD